MVVVVGAAVVVVVMMRASWKVTVMLCAALMVTGQVAAVPEQAPLHPAKLRPAAGVAVRMT